MNIITKIDNKLKSGALPHKTILAVLTILAIAVLLKFQPYQYIMGGQDQGTYLNIAHQYSKKLSLTYIDTFRTSLSPDQKSLYDTRINYLMPSIEMTDRANSVFVMKFYPMHPFIVSLFERVLGQNNAIFAMTVLSIISLFSLALIAYYLSGKNRLTFFITFALLATNPLHSFFSKFPVGEMTAVVFTSLGFLFLIKFIKEPDSKKLNLILSLLAFTGFFYTRMSSFMYLPVFLPFAFLAVLYIEDIKKKNLLLIYFLLLVGSFGLSYIFYYVFQPELFQLIYAPTVQKIFPKNSDSIIGASLLISFSLIFSVSRIKNKLLLTKIRAVVEKTIKIGTVALILVSIISSSLSLSTIELRPAVTGADFERYWFIGDGWFQKLKYLNLYVIMQYLTPVGLVLSLIAGFFYTKKFKENILKVCLFIFTIWFLFINTKFGDLVRYPYYFTRYVFSESVVYMLVLIGVFLGDLIANKITKVLGSILFSSIIICSLPFTLFQLNGPEGPHMDFYNNLSSIVTKKDLILTSSGYSTEKPQKYFDNFTTWSIAPLKFYYDLNIFILPEPADVSALPIKQLAQKYNKTFLISDKPLQDYGPNLITVRHKYSYYNTSEECSLHTYSFLPLESVKTMKLPKLLECLTPPNNYYTRYSNLYMYDITDSIKK